MFNIQKLNNLIINKYGVSYGLTIIDLHRIFPFEPGIIQDQFYESNFMPQIEMIGDKKIIDFFQSLLNLIPDDIEGIYFNGADLNFDCKSVDKSDLFSVHLNVIPDIKFDHDTHKTLLFRKRSLNFWIIKPTLPKSDFIISDIDNRFNEFFKDTSVYRLKNTLLYFQFKF